MINNTIDSQYIIELRKHDPGIIAIAETKNNDQVLILYDRDMNLYQAIGQNLNHCFLVANVHDTITKIREDFAPYKVRENADFYNLHSYEAVNLIDQIIKDIDSITYKEIKFRNVLHARWAAFFDTLGISYEYIKEPIRIGNKVTYNYQPDFYLPKQDAWMNINRNLLNYSIDRIMAYDFVSYTGKVLVVFNECKEPFNDMTKDTYLYLGQYMTIEGDCDGGQSWECCYNCNEFIISYLQVHTDCEKAINAAEIKEKRDKAIAKAFKTANLMFPEKY
ncbi:MAG: hypothetical protein HQK63_14540 [Desulfamplus sp.]|nr:hypothetical protein [Desulfamplus sp.]